MAGIKNIVTEGFGVRGQVDLIDFHRLRKCDPFGILILAGNVAV